MNEPGCIDSIVVLFHAFSSFPDLGGRMIRSPLLDNSGGSISSVPFPYTTTKDPRILKFSWRVYAILESCKLCWKGEDSTTSSSFV